MTGNIVLIGNPIAGGGALRKIKKAVNILKNKGFNVNLMLTSQKGDAESFARRISIEQQSSRAVEQQKELSDSNSLLVTTDSSLLVIAAGGDGTYNEVANGLVHSDIPMAILPLGTTCVLAKELGIPSTIEKALDIAINGREQTVHIGRITCNKLAHSSSLIDANLTISHEPSTISHTVTRYFLLMAGIGFDGEAVFGIKEKLKRYSGKGAYILSGLKALLKYNPSSIVISLRNGETKKTGYTAIVGKASCYGGTFKITPDARLTDPYLYVFVTHNKGRFDLLRYVAGIIKGTHLSFKDISYCSASEIEIQGNAHIQIDGDYIGTTPAKIDVVPDALKIIFPNIEGSYRTLQEPSILQ